MSISSEDGTIQSINMNPISQSLTDWPSATHAVTKDRALEDYLNQMDVELLYANHFQSDDSNKYHLVYRQTLKDNVDYYDALSGKWSKRNEEESSSDELISDHWAADELNYMIEADIISLEDGEEIKPNQVITKGEALEVIMKSLTRFYPEYPHHDENSSSTFENIDPDHDLYAIVERAVQQKIIDTDSATFEVDEPLTRQELAYWYIKALGLDAAAQHSDIYVIPFSDAEQIEEKYKGYVTLSSALDLLKGYGNGTFNPTNELTLAELAVSNFRLAQQVSELGVNY